MPDMLMPAPLSPLMRMLLPKGLSIDMPPPNLYEDGPAWSSGRCMLREEDGCAGTGRVLELVLL